MKAKLFRIKKDNFLKGKKINFLFVKKVIKESVITKVIRTSINLPK